MRSRFVAVLATCGLGAALLVPVAGASVASAAPALPSTGAASAADTASTVEARKPGKNKHNK